MTDPHERDLEEVERALSVLDGRHPEKVRAERLAAEALAKRQKEHEVEAARARRAALFRGAIALAVFAACMVVVVIVWRMVAARRAADAEIAPLVARYVALGFDVLPRTSSAQDRFEVTTTAGDCYAFIASRGAALRIERPIGTAGAPGEALVCTCASENIVVSAPGAVARGLHIAGSSLGGTRAASYRFTEHAPTTIAGDEACTDDMLAGFAREKRYPKQDADGAWLAAHHALAQAGFVTRASSPPQRPFAFVEPASARCFIAASTSSDALTLWAIEPSATTKPIQHATTALAWCAEKDASFVVERASPQVASPGTIVVVSAPVVRVGGMLGLRELARADGLAITAFEREDERGALALDTLRASVVPEPVATGCESIDAQTAQGARVLVFSNATADTFSTSDLDFRCTPALGEPESLCVQARALSWRAPPPIGDKNAVCAAAYGPLPYWMSAIAESHDAVDVELALVTFARKLAARGFSPGVIEGVTERVGAVEILGRSGDDSIVALGLWPKPPFAHPYTDGPEWTLDGEPRVIPMKGGDRISLPVHADVPPGRRRTVVFRHSSAVAIH